MLKCIQVRESAHKLVKKAIGIPLLGPEPTVGITTAMRMEAIKDVCKTKHYFRWISITIYRQTKERIGEFTLKLSKTIISFSKKNLRIMVGN